MSIEVTCPCGRTFTKPDHKAGTLFRCHLCGREVVIPDSGSAPTDIPLVPVEEPEELEEPSVDESEPRRKRKRRKTIVLEFPATLGIAARVWIFYGWFIVACTVLYLVLTVQNLTRNPPAALGAFCGMPLSFLFAYVFISVGRQYAQGVPHDTLGNGIASILLGLLTIGCGGLLVLLDASSRQPNWIVFVSGNVNMVGGLALMVAGILALVGRSAYKKWREAGY